MSTDAVFAGGVATGVKTTLTWCRHRLRGAATETVPVQSGALASARVVPTSTPSTYVCTVYEAWRQPNEAQLQGQRDIRTRSDGRRAPGPRVYEGANVSSAKGGDAGVGRRFAA